MKKIFLLLTVIAINSVSFAQISFDIRLGANLSDIPDNGYTAKFGIKTGALANYNFSNNFALKSGFYYSAKGVSDGDNPFDFSPDNQYELKYLEMPILASYYIGISEKFGLAFNAGPSVSYLLNKPSTEFDGIKSVDFGANMGLDFIFNHHFIVGAEAQYGFPELIKDSKAHNVTYSVMIGYRF